MSGYLGGLGDAAQSVGSSLYQQTGLQNLASGLQSLFGDTSEGARLQDLGQPVPQGVQLVGPSETFRAATQGPGFGQGFLEGFMNTLGPYAEPSAATSFGHGLGQLAAFIDRNRSGSGTLEGGGLGPIVNLFADPASAVPLWKRRPSPGPPVVKPEPTLIGNLVSAYTGGILRGVGA